MASLLRRIVAGPRAEHAETGLDLCYVTSNIIATSGPSQTYPRRAYRNPLDRLVSFLDAKHGANWAIWEFRAEGTGYPDEAVYGRIRHYPWPDHHPPPFRLVPLIVASMRQWLQGDAAAGGPGEKENSHERVVVVHCKAGKGRSGTMACSYLIAECGWKQATALEQFTKRRMRPSFGPGVTIPSQLRYIGYVERWARARRRQYVDRPIEIVEIHVWGLRHGVKLSVEGYVDEGKKIHVFHTFGGDERVILEGDPPGGGGLVDLVSDMAGTVLGTPEQEGPSPNTGPAPAPEKQAAPGTSRSSSVQSTKRSVRFAAEDEPGGRAVIFQPKKPIRVPNSDVNIDVERRNKTPASLMGLTMVTSVAHVWFNAYFEGNGPEQDGCPDDSGVFTIDWDKLDGIKGSSQKGSRAADRIAVVWRAADTEGGQAASSADTGVAAGTLPQPGAAGAAAATAPGAVVAPGPGEEVPQMRPADWHGGNPDPDAGKQLGLRKQDPESVSVSRASSVRGTAMGSSAVEPAEGLLAAGVQAGTPGGGKEATA